MLHLLRLFHSDWRKRHREKNNSFLAVKTFFLSLSLFLFHFDPNIKIYVYQRCSLPERSFVSFVNRWGVENIYHRKHITKAHCSIMLKYLWLLHFWFALFFNGGTHSMRAKAKVLCVHGVILVCLFENAIPWIKYANENFKCAETIFQIERWKKVRLNQSVIILNGMPFFFLMHILKCAIIVVQRMASWIVQCIQLNAFFLFKEKQNVLNTLSSLLLMISFWTWQRFAITNCQFHSMHHCLLTLFSQWNRFRKYNADSSMHCALLLLWLPRFLIIATGLVPKSIELVRKCNRSAFSVCHIHSFK